MVPTTIHEAVLHSSSMDLADRLVPRIDAALAVADEVVAVLDRDRRDTLRSALGDAADGVEFDDPAHVHSVPGFTVAVRWARRARAAAAEGVRMLVVGQHVDDLSGCGPEHWARFDVALAGLPVTVLCAVPADTPMLARVGATHPVVTTAAGSVRRPPHESIVAFPPPPPPEIGPPVATMRFGEGGLSEVRGLTHATAGTTGLDPERAADLVLAVNGLATDAVEHGAGTGALRLWVRSGGSSPRCPTTATV